MTAAPPPLQGQDPQATPSLGQAMGASPHDVQTRLEEEHYLQYRRAQYNHIQANNLLQSIEQAVQQSQQAEQEDVPPQDPEERTIWRQKTIHGELPAARVNRRLQADPDEGVLQEVERTQFARTAYRQFYERGQNMAAHKMHAGAALPDKLARTIIGAGDDGRLMYDQAELWAMKDRDYQGNPGIEQALSGLTNFEGPESRYPKAIKPGGHEQLIPREKQRDLAFEAMKQGYAETIAKASGSRKAAIQALELIGSTVPYVAAAGALPGGAVGAAATGGAIGAVEPLSGEDKQAVDQANERGESGGKMEAELRALRGVQGAVQWGLMGLGGKVSRGTTLGGRVGQAAGMHVGSEAGAAATDATKGIHESITGKDPGVQSAIGKALVALSDPGLSPEERDRALIEAGTQFGVGMATFAAVHVATGLREIAPRTMARPENAEAVARLEKAARVELRSQDVEPETIAQVLPSAEKVKVQVGDRVDTRAPAHGTQEGVASIGEALPPEPHVTPPGPPARLSKAERAAMGEALEPGTRFKLHDSVTLGNGGELEVTRNEVGAEGVIQVRDQAGKTIDLTPDMLDLVLPESMREAEAVPVSRDLRPPAINPTSEATVPAFSRAGKRPEPTMEVPAHEAEAPFRVTTPEGKRVPVDVQDPQGPVVTTGTTLPDGTRVEAHGESLEQASGKLEEQLGVRGAMEATGEVGRAVEGVQKEKAVEALKAKRPGKKTEPAQAPEYAKEPYGTLKLDPEHELGMKGPTSYVDKETGEKVLTDAFSGKPTKDVADIRVKARERFIKEAKARGDRIEYSGNEIKVYRRTRPEERLGISDPLSLALHTAMGWLKRNLRAPRAGLVREMDRATDQERFATHLRQGLGDMLAKHFGGPSRRIGMELAGIAKQHWWDMNARLGKIAERMYDRATGFLRGVRSGSDLVHDLFVAADRPTSPEGKEAEARVAAAGRSEDLRSMRRELEYFRRFWAGHGPEAQTMRKNIRSLRDAVTEAQAKLDDPNYLAKVPAPLARVRRARLEKKVDGWQEQLDGERQALAQRIKTWGKTGGYMHHVFEEMQNDQGSGFRASNQAFLEKVAGARSIGFRGLKHRVGKEGFIEDAVVAMGHYVSGAVRKIYTDRILRDWSDRMEGQWKRLGKPYANKAGETVDPLKFVKAGEQFREGADLVEVRDIERTESGEVTGVQVQVIGAGKGSEKHPAEWLLPDEARGLQRRFGLRQMAQHAHRLFWGYFGEKKVGENRAFIDAYKEYEEMIRRGAHTDIMGWIDAGEAALRKTQGLLFNTISRWFPGSLRSAPANAIQNSAIIMEKIGPDNLVRGAAAAFRAFKDRRSTERWLLRDSGVMDRRQTKADFMQETGRLMPRQGLARAVDATDRVMGGLYDGVEAYSRATAYLGHYLALRPGGLAHQEGAMSHKAARARARETVEQACGVYDSWMAPKVLRTQGVRLLTGMKGYLARQAGEYLPNRIREAKQTGDTRALIRMAASASMLSGGLYLGSRLLFGWDKTEGQSLSNRLGTRAKDVPFINHALAAAEKVTGVNMDWLTVPYLQTNLFDKGPGPDLWENVAHLFDAKDGREAVYRAELIGKAIFSVAPYGFRQFAQATANPDGSFSTYDAGSVWEALMPYQRATGPVRDKNIREADLTLRLITGTPIRDLAMRAASQAKAKVEEETRGEHADTLDMILEYRRMRRQGQEPAGMLDQIRDRARAQGSMPDMGTVERMERLRNMGREGRLLFSGTKEARAQALQDYSLLKGHDEQMLRLGIGELFKEPGGLSRETVEKLRSLVR